MQLAQQERNQHGTILTSLVILPGGMREALAVKMQKVHSCQKRKTK